MPSDNQIQRAKDRLALQAALEGTGGSIQTTHAEKVLGKAGVDPLAAAEEGEYLNALNRMAQKGGVMGKRAKMLTQGMEIKNLEGVAKGGEDDIARAYENMTNQFTASLGPGVDVGSPAVLDAVRRYMEGRSSDTMRWSHTIAGEKNNILSGIASTLDETGSLVDSLKMLKDEQDMYRRSLYMNLGMGAAGLGVAGAGALSGGSAGATTAGAGASTIPPMASLFGMFPV